MRNFGCTLDVARRRQHLPLRLTIDHTIDHRNQQPQPGHAVDEFRERDINSDGELTGSLRQRLQMRHDVREMLESVYDGRQLERWAVVNMKFKKKIEDDLCRVMDPE